MSVFADGRDIALRQQVAAVGNCFPSSQSELWQGLTEAHMKVGIHLKEGLTVTIHTRNNGTIHPLILGLKPGVQARNSCGNARTNSVARSGAQLITEHRVFLIRKRQCTAEGINCGPIDVFIKLLATRVPQLLEDPPS